MCLYKRTSLEVSKSGFERALLDNPKGGKNFNVYWWMRNFTTPVQEVPGVFEILVVLK